MVLIQWPSLSDEPLAIALLFRSLIIRFYAYFFRFIFILFCQNIRRYEIFGASGFYVYANQESVCI